ncbi:hypothetical protein CFC21_100048 [Triticum aestivum]|uniref:Leucine-rich repeat-containing N-terminal plant-type domain-containing protein n=2 Tax=Triticum aestivum TaxID=4565 RepID=A0A3B6RR50_WHEAT|nr:hypothetical protein CFC21_100048 [Triticum aestivum]
MFSDGASGLLLLVLAAFAAAAAAASEGDVLLTFRATLRGPVGDRPPAPLDQWVLGLRLEYLGLQGAAPDMAPLAALLGLRVLSFANNNLTGAFPAGLSVLPALKTLYLSRNRLTGDIPDGAFADMRGLKKLLLGDNAFTGPIPGSITSPKLLGVQLARNRFQGAIRNFDQKDLQLFNVSNNQLSGPIPEVLSRFDAASFQGEFDRSLHGDVPALQVIISSEELKVDEVGTV